MWNSKKNPQTLLDLTSHKLIDRTCRVLLSLGRAEQNKFPPSEADVIGPSGPQFCKQDTVWPGGVETSKCAINHVSSVAAAWSP